jgi:hypothetical protein
MAEPAPTELSVPHLDPNLKKFDEVGAEEIKQEVHSRSSTETSSLNGEKENENTDMQTSITQPTRPKVGEKTNSYFEERNDQPGTRRWKSLLNRNLAANPGSSEHEV